MKSAKDGDKDGTEVIQICSHCKCAGPVIHSRSYDFWHSLSGYDVSNFSPYWSIVDVRIVASVCTCLGIFNQKGNEI